MQRGPFLVVIGALFGSCILVFFVQFISPTRQTVSVVQAASLVDQSASDTSIQGDQNMATTNFEDCQVSLAYPEDIRQWCVLITGYAGQHNLAPDLVAALIWQESGGNPTAYSKSGAVGLMQVMPRDGLAANFMCKNGPCFSKRPTIYELEDPEFNVKYGTKMLAGLVNRNGNMRDALKAYGPMDVGYYYADKVLGIYERYKG
jgi:soluble lytic murein transglycosylase-like protein